MIETYAVFGVAIATLSVAVSKLLDKYMNKNSGSNRNKVAIQTNDIHHWLSPDQTGIQQWMGATQTEKLKSIDKKLGYQIRLLENIDRNMARMAGSTPEQGGAP